MRLVRAIQRHTAGIATASTAPAIIAGRMRFTILTSSYLFFGLGAGATPQSASFLAYSSWLSARQAVSETSGR